MKESLPVTLGQGFGFICIIHLYFKLYPPWGCWRYFQGKNKNGIKAGSAMWVEKQSWSRNTNSTLTRARGTQHLLCGTSPAPKTQPGSLGGGGHSYPLKPCSHKSGPKEGFRHAGRDQLLATEGWPVVAAECQPRGEDAPQSGTAPGTEKGPCPPRACKLDPLSMHAGSLPCKHAIWLPGACKPALCPASVLSQLPCVYKVSPRPSSVQARLPQACKPAPRPGSTQAGSPEHPKAAPRPARLQPIISIPIRKLHALLTTLTLPTPAPRLTPGGSQECRREARASPGSQKDARRSREAKRSSPLPAALPY